MKVDVRQVEPAESGADLLAVGLFAGADPSAPIAAAAGAESAQGDFKKTTLLRPDGFPPVLVVGLGERDEVDAERLRVAAALAAKEARGLQAGSLAWALPGSDDPAV